MQNPDFYWLRQPLISIERLLAVLNEDRLFDLLSDSKVGQAIQIAWPTFDEYVSDKGLTDPKVAETIIKYILRMSTRCTPFGLFAGGTVGYIAQTSDLNFTNRHLISKHRLDNQVVINLAYKLSSHPAIRTNLRYFANRSVHQVGNRLRYTESQWRASKWQYFTSEVSCKPSLLAVLSLAQSGATIANLAKTITTDEHQNEAYKFIEHLIDDGLLISELVPTPTGIDSLNLLIQRLHVLPGGSTLVAHLEHIKFLLTTTNDELASLNKIRSILSDHLNLSLDDTPVTQTDTLIDGGNNQLSARALGRLSRSLNKLHVLSRYNPINPTISSFKQRFYARYEEQEIPLLLALDEEEGIGYDKIGGLSSSAQELIKDLLDGSLLNSVSTFQGDRLHELMLQLYTRWAVDMNAPVVITDEDLAHLDDFIVQVPTSYYAFGYFLASSTESIDEGRFLFALKALSGPSAFTLMGRFCSNDNSLERLVKSQFDQQQASDPHRIYAEIAHLPQGRAGNVVQRPHLRSFEIPYLTESTLPAENQLLLDDLMVSVPNGQRIVLRSKRLNKEVIPQLSTAHDHRAGLPLYRFLCDLQYQDVPFSVKWDWRAFNQARRLPRVQYQNIILQEATWLFSLSDLKPTLSDDENIIHLQQKEGVPRLIAIQQNDQELFLDLASSVCRQLFLSTLRRVKTIQVIEWLRTPDNCPVNGPDGKLTHELVIPFVKLPHNSIAQSPVLLEPDNVYISQRRFLPGSEWFYIKVYCGFSIAGPVLDQLARLADQAWSDGRITHWFFVRYLDPHPHLRVRFCLTNVDQSASLLQDCRQALSVFLVSGEVYQIQVDTYERELERYGEATIVQTEQIFWRDSQVVTQLLGLNLTESSLLTAALLGIDAYHTAFGLTRKEKLQLCEQVYTELFGKNGGTSSVRQTLARKYRINQESVKKNLQQQIMPEEVPIYKAIQYYHKLILPYVDQVRLTQNTYNLSRRWHYISSLGHLFINRLFHANQRTYELLVYHHLYRAHKSILAQQSED